MKIDIDEAILKSKEKISCIYAITNLINKKKYIGQTTNLRKRVSDYRNADKKFDTRPITLDIKRIGKDNFSMSVIEYCDTERLSDRENYFIEKFNTKNPKYGYNLISNKLGNNTEESRKHKSISHIGIKESSTTKRKKSNFVFAVDDKMTTVIISDSAKLFGDFINRTKDYAKAMLRTPYKYNGWYLFYDDFNKRQEIRSRVYSKHVLSERNIQYLKILDYFDRIELSEDVETIYLLFDVYSLSYDKIDSNNKPIPKMLSNAFTASLYYELE